MCVVLFVRLLQLRVLSVSWVGCRGGGGGGVWCGVWFTFRDVCSLRIRGSQGVSWLYKELLSFVSFIWLLGMLRYAGMNLVGLCLWRYGCIDLEFSVTIILSDWGV